MAKTNTLHVRQGRNQGDKHLLYLLRLPKQGSLLSFAEDILQILTLLNVFTDYSDTVCVVHSLVEEVTVELYNVLVVLSLE